VVGCFEYGKEPSDFIRVGDLLMIWTPIRVSRRTLLHGLKKISELKAVIFILSSFPWLYLMWCSFTMKYKKLHWAVFTRWPVIMNFSVMACHWGLSRHQISSMKLGVFFSVRELQSQNYVWFIDLWRLYTIIRLHLSKLEDNLIENKFHCLWMIYKYV
jgi:hypothetical protein